MTALHFTAQRAGLIARALGAACLVAAQGAAAQEISKAETLLFQSDHFRQVHAPATLNYTFHKESNIAAEPGFDDDVRLSVAAGKRNGPPTVKLRFLSGSRQRETPEVENLQGNPALLGFLERDIAEMKRLTGGATNYFRKRIRLALAEAAQVKPVQLTYRGKPVAAQEVRIEPYRDDPLHDRFEQYVHKIYVFILSDQVPGAVLQLRTSLSDASGGGAEPGAKVLDETLTLAGVATGKP